MDLKPTEFEFKLEAETATMASFKVIELLWFMPHLICIPWRFITHLYFTSIKTRYMFRKDPFLLHLGF